METEVGLISKGKHSTSCIRTGTLEILLEAKALERSISVNSIFLFCYT